jgi:formamidopyrimidine-DNA glycosylase
MPELPEVETIRRALERLLAGRRIVRVWARPVMMRRPLDADALHRHLLDRCFGTLRRRGKFLLLDVDREGALLIHLGMSGRLLVIEASADPLPHTHLRLDLDNGKAVHLVDPRRFGLAVWLPPGAESSDPSLSGLGIEPLTPGLEHSFPPLAHTRRAPIKAVLLDQSVIAGVGNIYATEALWRAGIRPSRPACSVSLRRLRALAGAVQDVLREAIELGGTTVRDYTAPQGDLGAFAMRLEAYGRAGASCPRCQRPLSRTIIAGRSTVWCRGCQR